MATLAVGEKARMYALGAIARGGATRGAYRSADVFINIGGNYTQQRVVSALYPDLVKRHGATNYWRLNEQSGTTAVDSIGGKTGTISGGVTRGQAGALADGTSAMTFNGTSGTISTGAVNVTTPVPATLELWIKFTSTAPALSVAFSNRAGAGAGGIYLGMSTGVLVMYNNANGVASGRSIADGNWHHIVTVWGTTTVTLYIDGVAETLTGAGRTVSGTGQAFMAAENGAGFFPGSLDEVAVYPKALTAAQVQQHYAARLLKLPVGRVLMDSLSITDVLEQTPNTATFTTMGLQPVLGQDVLITLGSRNTLSPIFAGKILKSEQIYLVDNPDNIAYHIDAIDHTPLLDRRVVIAIYRNQSATAIAKDLIATWPQGFTATNVQAGLPVLDEISFTNTSLTDALTQLAKRIGGYFYVDYAKDLHLFVGTEAANAPPRPLTATHPTLQHVVLARDRSQIVTRVFSEGGGASLQAAVGPGETILPVDTIAWYNPNGGRAICAQNRFQYAKTFAGGGGTLVGPGIQPSSAPTVALASGVGVTIGTHDYAVSFLTAVGESLVGPRATINVTGAAANPASPPTVLGAVGGTEYPLPGAYAYAVTFATATGETLPSPTAAFNQTPIAAPTTGATLSQRYDGTHYSPNFPWRVGATLAIYVTYSNVNGRQTMIESYRGPASNMIVLEPDPVYPTYLKRLDVTVPMSPDPRTKYAFLWASVDGGAVQLLNDTADDNVYNNPNQSTYFISLAPFSSSFYQPGGGTAGGGNVSLNVPLGPAGTTGRKLYRTGAGGAQLKLLATLDNTATAYTDALADSSLGANAPTASTASAGQVQVSAVPLGPPAVTQRKVYRTPVGSTQLKYVGPIGDNATTATLDNVPDASLGANAPTSDTSGLKQPDGAVLAGATSLLVAGAAAFRTTGGWALGAGGQAIRYTGISGNSLIGIPATGFGAVLATISYNSTITAAPAIEGVSGITLTLKQGDPVNLYWREEDTNAQAMLAAMIGGDGVVEAYIQDGRLSETEAAARARALIAQRNQIEVTLTYACRDPNARSGATVHIDLPSPTSITGDYKIQQVTFSGFQFPHVYPLCTVTASSNRFSFEDLLRLARNMAPT